MIVVGMVVSFVEVIVKVFLAVLLVQLIAGCGADESYKEQDGELTARERLVERDGQVATELLGLKEPVSGWPAGDDCDRVLFAGLACAAGDTSVRLELAELSPGVLGRRSDRACWTKEEGDLGAKSTTSEDMFQGWAWCAWRRGDVGAFQRFAAAGEAREIGWEEAGLPAWVIGEPYPEMASRVVLRPNGVGLVGRAIYALTAGVDSRPYRGAWTAYLGSQGEAPYERHLAALGIGLQGEVNEAGGGSLQLLDINGQMLDRLRQLVGEDPADWTAQAVLGVYTGDYETAFRVLLDPQTPCPGYAEAPVDCKVSWRFAAHLVLKRTGG